MRTRLPFLVPAAVLAAAVSAVACDEHHDPDPRYASPEATLDTLMASYGVEDMSQDEIEESMRKRARFELRDENAYRGCFVDYRGPQDEGLAGFVFGTVAAGKDQLEIKHIQGKVHVYPDPERLDRSVVLVENDGEWKISLRDSVPSSVRRALTEEFRRMSDLNRRAGRPE